MASRRLDPKMIANLHDVVERRLYDVSALFVTSLAVRVKDGVRKEFHGC